MANRLKSTMSRAANGRPTSPDSAFERRFCAAARRVLKRRGVPEDRIEAEIARIKRMKPAIPFPTVEDLEKAIADAADAR